MKKVIINGELVAAKTASVSIFDRGLLYGDGLFETVRVYNGKPFMLAEHIERLTKGAKTLGIPTSRLRGINSRIKELLRANGLHKGNDASIRITITRGTDSLTAPGFRPEKKSSSTLIITTRSINTNKIKELQRSGVKATLMKGTSLACAGIKSLNFLPGVRAATVAQSKNAYEVIFHDGEYITECSASNIFIITSKAKNKTLITPKADKTTGILPGITRALVIKTAKYMGIKVREAPIKISELKSAEEAFITNSLIEIVPLIAVDKKKIIDNKSCLLTRELQATFTEITAKL